MNDSGPPGAADPPLTMTDPIRMTRRRRPCSHSPLRATKRSRQRHRNRRLVAAVAGCNVRCRRHCVSSSPNPPPYTVDKHADGSIAVSFRAGPPEGHEQLNANCAGRCAYRRHADDPAVSVHGTARHGIRCSVPHHRRTPEELNRYPVSYRSGRRPGHHRPADKIPAADTWPSDTPSAMTATATPSPRSPQSLRTVPSCMAIRTRPGGDLSGASTDRVPAPLGALVRLVVGWF